MRTFGVWLFGILGAGIAGAILSIAILNVSYDEEGFLAFLGGFLAGAFGFACLRLWLANPTDNSN